MQGLADGYFVIPNTIAPYLADLLNKPVPDTSHPEFAKIEQEARDRFTQYMNIGGTENPTTSTVNSARSSGTTAAWIATPTASRRPISEIPALHEEFKKDLRVTGSDTSVNQTLEKAGWRRRLLRPRHVDVQGRAEPRGKMRRAFPRGVPDRGGRGGPQRRGLRLRQCWESTGDMDNPAEHKEPLHFRAVKFQTRSYKWGTSP